MTDQALFHIEMLAKNKSTHTNLVKFKLQLLFSNEIFAQSNMVSNEH